MICTLLEELIQLIFSHLDTQHDPDRDTFDYSRERREQHALVALCQVNKLCHRLATPMLYRVFSPATTPDVDNVSKLLRTLLAKPEIAGYIATIDASYVQLDESEDLEDEIVDEFDIRDCHLAPLRLLDDQDHLYIRVISGLRRGRQPACLILLLIIAKNIKTIHLEVPFDPDDTMTIELLSRLSSLAGTELAILSRLETLSLSWYDTEGALSLSEVGMLPRIPTLLTLRGRMVDITGSEMETSFGHEHCSIRKIELDHSLADASGICQLLSCCPLLETLSIEWGSAIVGDDYEIRWAEIGDALREHGRSLKSIEFNTADAFYYEYGDETSHPPLGDLTALSALEQLAVPVIALLGEDNESAVDFPTFDVPKDISKTLPESLQYLEILQAEFHAVEELGKQLEMITTLTRMQRIRIFHTKTQDILEHFEDSKWQRRTSLHEVIFEKSPAWGCELSDRYCNLTDSE